MLLPNTLPREYQYEYGGQEKVPVLISPLSPTIGAKITDIDLSKPLSDDDSVQILEAWKKYHLLCFPSQRLTDAEHIRFCELFGPIQKEADGSLVSYVTNRGKSGFVAEERFEWHMDYCFTPFPSLAISLNAKLIPISATTTSFANNRTGLTRLPNALREKIADLKIRNMADFVGGDQTAILYKLNRSEKGNPSNIDNLVREHPVLREPMLYCSHMMTTHVLGMELDESRALLANIFKYLYAPDNVYVHTWSPNQLIIWDNIALQHSRPDVSSALGERTLRRVCVAEDNPVEYLAPYWAAYERSRAAIDAEKSRDR